jgi:hypothetical protein
MKCCNPAFSAVNIPYVYSITRFSALIASSQVKAPSIALICSSLKPLKLKYLTACSLFIVQILLSDHLKHLVQTIRANVVAIQDISHINLAMTVIADKCLILLVFPATMAALWTIVA